MSLNCILLKEEDILMQTDLKVHLRIENKDVGQ